VIRRAKLVRLHPTEPELTDAGVVAACAAGDRGARAMLFERHVDAIHRFVARMRASDAHAVDDLVQTTFMRAFAAAARFRGASTRSWLFGIAANVVREHARSEIRRKRTLYALADASQRPPAVRDELALARLPQLIAALPHDLRAAFVLVDLEGERGSDAAAALGVPEGTLWRHVFHARQALRRGLGSEPACNEGSR
jgi:RNA polymerase sigma-70 factor (ECF subfamily)